MGKAGKTRRHKEHMSKKRAAKAARAAAYQGMAGRDENRKKKRADGVGGRKLNPFKKKRVRVKRMTDIPAHVRAEYDKEYGQLHKNGKLTWKQAHNTMSLKQFLKTL